MEVGQTASHMAALHYTNRWDAMGEREPFYSTESWKDRRFSAIGASTHTWSGGIATPDSSSSPSPSSVLPSSVTDGVVDKVLYHNLVEMIPLVETFMEQQQQQQHNNKSFPRHASLIYTPTPCDTLKASDHPFKGKKGRGQLFGDNQVEQNSHSNAMVAQLQDQMEQLELKLLEKDSQLQAAESSSRQADLLHLKASVEELQGQISLKEMEIQKAIHQLSKTQHEVASLHSLLEKAESEVEESSLTVAKVHEESQNLQCQVAAILLWMESISSCLDDQTVDNEPGSLLTVTETTMENKKADQKHASQMLELDAKHVELTRRKYLASLVAARRNPSDELLLLVAELRGQLQAYLMHPNAHQWV